MNILSKHFLLCLLAPLAVLAQDYRPQPTDADKARMAAAVPASALVKVAKPRQVLVYCDHKGFYHTSIPFANEALKILGKATGAFEVTVATDASCFEPENLKKFDVIFLNNNTSRSPWGQVPFKHLPEGAERTRLEQREARLRQGFLDFVRTEGKGVVGLHAATDAMYDWPEYGDMLGGFFNAHPWSERVGVELCDAGHPTMRGWGGSPFYIRDEIYQQRAPYSRDKQRVLMRLDVTRCDMTKKDIRRTDGDFALAWIKRYGKGRVGYIAFGHYHELFWNKGMLTMMLDFIQYAAGDLQVDDRPSSQLDEAYLQQSAVKGFTEGTRQLVADLADYRYSVDDAAAKRIDALANRLEAPENAAQAAVLSQLLAELLVKQGTSVDARNFILRQLSRLAGDSEVPAIASQLRDAATVDMAMYCLQRLPGAAAGQALLDALKALPQHAGALASMLGQRRFAPAVPALAELLTKPEHAVLAAQALGAIADEPAANALVKALPQAQGELKLAIFAALAECASVAEAGEALANAADAPAHVRATGLAAQLKRRGTAGIPAALELLAKGEEFSCAAVSQALREMPGGLAAALAKIGAGLPSSAAVFVLKAAGDSGDAALEAAVLKALASADKATATAAAKALETIGGQASVLPLAAITAEPTAKAAARTLERMRGEGVTALLIKEVDNTAHELKTRASLLRTLGNRKEGTATFFGRYVLAEEKPLVKEAIAALALIAKEGDAAELAKAIAGVKTAADRSRLVKIAVATGRRAEKCQAYVEVMLQALTAATEVKVREAFITVLGALGQEQALSALVAELESSDATIKRAAILALSDWPTPSPLPALRKVSTDASATSAHRALALRGYAHLLALPSRRPIRETLAMYREAFALAKTAQEKQSLVGGLADLIHPDALKLAMEYKEIPELADEATLTAAKIWQGLNGDSLKLTASHGSKPQFAIDGNRKTRWTTNKLQSGNEWFMIDIGYETTISEIFLDAGDEGNDAPEAFEVYVSLDGQNWGDKPVLTGRGTSRQLTLKPANAYGRYVKIVQKGQRNMYWSICEMSVNGIPGRRGQLIPAEQLKLTSSHNQGVVGRMLDGNRRTRWDSGTRQTAGMWLTIELPRLMEVRSIVMDAATSRRDYPRGYRVEVSEDGKTWHGPLGFGQGNQEITRALLLPGKGKFVKITLTENENTYFWSIHALSVYAD